MIIYSPSTHTANVSGFYFLGDPNAPSDAFDVTEPDHSTAVNLPIGATYTFTAPVAPATTGTLIVTSAPTLTAAELLAQAQTVQIAVLQAAYQAAIIRPVSYTTVAGTTAIFNQTSEAITNLQNALIGSQKSQAWSLNLWLSAAGQPVTPFTYTDLQGLAAAIEAADAPAYQELLTKIAEVQAATTVVAVQAITF